MASTMVPASKQHPFWIKTGAITCAVGTAYFLAAWLSLDLTQGVGGVATIWPASGVFVSALLLVKRVRILPIVCAVSAASFAVNIMFGAPLSIASAFTLANVAEGLLISHFVLRRSGAPRSLDDARWLLTFSCATILGSLISGLIAAVLTSTFSAVFFVSWVTTVSLGTLIVTPLIVTLADTMRRARGKLSHRKEAGLAVLLGTIAIISSLVLSFDDTRFLFLPMMGVIAATFLFGTRGAALSISVISVVAIFQADFGEQATIILGLDADTLFLQFYLISLLLAAWPLAVLITEKAQLIDQYSEANALLTMAESMAKVGHWYIGPDNSSLFWSEEVYRIHQIDPVDLEIEDSLDLEDDSSLRLYHPRDRDRVRQVLLSAMEHRVGFSYKARIIRPDGSIAYVESVGHPRFDEFGKFDGLFGTFQDITEQTQTLADLNEARRKAVTEAATAKRLSETDELTGVANRRKALAKLRSAARAAKHKKQPLTLAIFDIDHFKLVNDRYGHSVGDRVLRRVAKIVSDQLRPSDFFGRLGGEEFLIILPDSNEADSFHIVERLRNRIESERWMKGGPASLTISAGLATMEPYENAESALNRADVALYRAKDEGRNMLRSAA